MVTGAGRGLGRRYALLLAERGARVVVNDLGASVTGEGADPGAADSTVREIDDNGGEAIGDTNSVATREGARAIIEPALDHWGRADIVINNAGTVSDAPFEEMTGRPSQPDDRRPPEGHLSSSLSVRGQPCASKVSAVSSTRARQRGSLVRPA